MKNLSHYSREERRNLEGVYFKIKGKDYPAFLMHASTSGFFICPATKEDFTAAFEDATPLFDLLPAFSQDKAPFEGSWCTRVLTAGTQVSFTSKWYEVDDK